MLAATGQNLAANGQSDFPTPVSLKLPLTLLSCTVLTTTTQDALGHVHDRSPVIIPRERFGEWLDPDLTDKNDIQRLLDSLPEPTLTPRVVSPRVNSVRNNGPELIEPAEPAAT